MKFFIKLTGITILVTSAILGLLYAHGKHLETKCSCADDDEDCCDFE